MIIKIVGSANFLCKGTDRKYFRLVGHTSLCHNSSGLPLKWEGSHQNEWARLYTFCTKLDLQNRLQAGFGP